MGRGWMMIEPYMEHILKDIKDISEKEIILLRLCQELHFAYVNKDVEMPHEFEKEALEFYQKVMIDYGLEKFEPGMLRKWT